VEKCFYKHFVLISTGNVLAHAFFPSHGGLHFDDDEEWHVKPGKNEGTELFHVTLHELGIIVYENMFKWKLQLSWYLLSGHSLGLGHNDRLTSVMYPYYQNKDKDYLDDMDKACMVHLYGNFKQHQKLNICVCFYLF